MNNATIICLTYAVYLLAVAIILVAAWYSEKLDPENDLPASIWDEILPPKPAPADEAQAAQAPDLQIVPAREKPRFQPMEKAPSLVSRYS